ncbi:MAG: EamA family transporter [Candidatus Acidiferrales bacterium]
MAFAFAAIYLGWGSTYLAIRVAVHSFPPLLMMGARHMIAGALLYAILRGRGAALLSPREWRGALITGAFFMLGGHGSLAWAEQHVTSGLAALLAATIPLWMVLLSPRREGEPWLTAQTGTGLALGAAGVALLIGPDALHRASRADLLGAGAVLFAAISWAIGSSARSRLHLPSSSAMVAAAQMLVGGALLLITGSAFGETRDVHLASIPPRAVFAFGYLIVVGSLLGFTAYIWLLSVRSHARVATYAYVNPVVAVFLGWALGGEHVSPRILVAAAIIVAGVFLAIRNPVQREHEEPVERSMGLDGEEEEATP